MQKQFDFIVIGGGILGLSAAWQLLQRFPGASLALLEKEGQLAAHQTGHNSGVIHAGVYYQPGSLKARYCLEGNRATKAFCRSHGIAVEECGKLLVATSEVELERMQKLQRRAQDNGLETQVLDTKELRSLESNVAGLGAILVPDTAIVSFTAVAQKMADLIQQLGGALHLGHQVLSLSEHQDHIQVKSSQGEIRGRYLVSCGGLYSDRLVRMLGLQPEFKIIPFRGDYYRLRPAHNKIIQRLIYPIPDPDLPFLGVHLTRMIDGSVTVGPNAVLAFKREGYNRFDFSLSDSVESLSYPGFYRLLRHHIGSTLKELANGFSKRRYLSRVQKYCPHLRLDDLEPYPSGVRAQAVSRDGKLVDDFLFMNTERSVNVCNAPSPAATSALPIGAHIVEQVAGLVSELE